MDLNQLLGFAAGNGFAVAVALYLLIRLDKRLHALTAEFRNLVIAIAELRTTFRAKLGD